MTSHLLIVSLLVAYVCQMATSWHCAMLAKGKEHLFAVVGVN